MTDDRQTARFVEARKRHHEAQQAHREAVLELERAGAELTVAAAAVVERIRLTSTAPKAGLRSAA